MQSVVLTNQVDSRPHAFDTLTSVDMKIFFERVSVKQASMALRALLLAVLCIAAGSVAAKGLSPYDDINAPENSTQLMPQAARTDV